MLKNLQVEVTVCNLKELSDYHSYRNKTWQIYVNINIQHFASYYKIISNQWCTNSFGQGPQSSQNSQGPYNCED